jgi:uncharacterized membrane protein YcjF (UPF0283 family)
MLRDLWRIVARITAVAGLLLGFLVVVELFRAFVFFYRLNHTLGWVFAGFVLLLAILVPIYIWSVWVSLPKVLRPPSLPDPEKAGFRELYDYCRYLADYLRRLEKNPHFEAAHKDLIRDRIASIQDTLKAHPLKDDLRRAIAKTEEETIFPLLDFLAGLANTEVRRSVRDVMLGVTLSPYHSVDLVVVLFRNASMVLRVARVFSSRPDTREQFLVLRDVGRVIITVNFLYIGRHLIENLFSSVPLIGRVVDDIGQGLGAGLFTSAAGHAAIDRCAAFRGWSREEAADTLASQTKAFLVDVKDIFTRDVLPDLKGRIRTEVPVERAEQPGFWDTISNGITSAVDSTAGALGTLVVKPAVAGTKGMMQAGAAVSRTMARRENTSSENQGHRRRRKRRRSRSRPFGTLGQRIKYAFKKPAP